MRGDTRSRATGLSATVAPLVVRTVPLRPPVGCANRREEPVGRVRQRVEFGRRPGVEPVGPAGRLPNGRLLAGGVERPSEPAVDPAGVDVDVPRRLQPAVRTPADTASTERRVWRRADRPLVEGRSRGSVVPTRWPERLFSAVSRPGSGCAVPPTPPVTVLAWHRTLTLAPKDISSGAMSTYDMTRARPPRDRRETRHATRRPAPDDGRRPTATDGAPTPTASDRGRDGCS